MNVEDAKLIGQAHGILCSMLRGVPVSAEHQQAWVLAAEDRFPALAGHVPLATQGEEG
jgi:hypothetical protein